MVYLRAMSKGKLVLAAVGGFLLLVFGYVYWMDRDLILPERRAADLALLFGATLGGLMLASIAWNLLLLPAMRQEPRHRWKWAAGALAGFLGIVGGMPWIIRAAWGYRSALTIVVVAAAALFLLIGLVFALTARKLRNVEHL